MTIDLQSDIVFLKDKIIFMKLLSNAFKNPSFEIIKSMIESSSDDFAEFSDSEFNYLKLHNINTDAFYSLVSELLSMDRLQDISMLFAMRTNIHVEFRRSK